MSALIVNLYGGPGSGKSTMAAALFAELKESGITAELVTEYAKDKTWEEAFHVLNDQLYIFAKQYHRLWRVASKVDVIITDSPLLLSATYDNSRCEELRKLIFAKHKEFNTLNVFLKRVKKYQTTGRSQTEEEAIKIDYTIYDYYRNNFGNFDIIEPGKETTRPIIINHIKQKLSHA